MLTRNTGGASDVAGMNVDGGSLVTWVDERSGDAEVYAARVGRNLEKASPERASRPTAPRPSDCAHAPGRQALRAVVGCAPPKLSGWADVYGAFLRPGDAARPGKGANG